MNSTLDGAGVAHSYQVFIPHQSMTQTENVPTMELISWTQTAHERSAALRRERIAVEAYCAAEARGFEPGHDVEDWLFAQAKIDAIDAGAFEG